MQFATEVNIFEYRGSGKWQKSFSKLWKPQEHSLLILTDNLSNIDILQDMGDILSRGWHIVIASPDERTPITDSRITYIQIRMAQYQDYTFENLQGINSIMTYGNSSYWLGQNLSQQYSIPYIPDKEDLDTTGKEAILIQTYDGVGDQLMAIPAIKTHAEKYGRAVDVNVRNVEIFANLPYIRRVYAKDENINPDRYLVMYSTSLKLSCYEEEYCRQHRIKATAECCGLNGGDLVTYKPEIVLTKKEILRGYELTQVSNSKKKIVVSLHSTDIRRSYPMLQRQVLINKLAKIRDTEVVVVGDIDGHTPHFDNCIDLIGKTNLRELFAVVYHADVVVTIDSSVTHIAGAFDKPTILLPSTIPADWRKYKNTIIIKPRARCYPCNGAYKNLEKVECSRVESYCLGTIPQDEIVKQAQKLLTKKVKETSKIIKYNKGESILFNRISGLGDVLMVTAVVNAIKESNPQTKITFRTNHAELLRGNPSIDKIIEANTGLKGNEEKEYDKVIDFDWCTESKTVSGSLGKCSEEDYMNVTRMDIFFKQAGIVPPKYPRMTYNISTEETSYAKSIVEQLKGKYTVVYSLNATSAFRTMPIDLSLEIIGLLLSQKVNVITIGDNYRIWGKYPGNFNEHYYEGIKEFDKDYFLDLTDKTNVREAIALVGNSDLIICPDTGTLHLTNALGVPCIGLFGDINPELRCYYYDNVRTIWKNIPCAEDCGDRAPIIQRKCPHVKDLSDWNLMEVGATCMQVISPKEVFDLAIEMLGLLIPEGSGSETYRIRSIALPYCRGRGLDIGAVGDGQCLTVRDTSIIVDRSKGRDPALTVADFNSNKKESSIIADARDLSMIGNEKYDYIYSSHMLEDLEDEEIVDTLNGWFRVLKNNGNLIIYCPVQRVYVRHCIHTGQSLNRDHKIEYFSLRYVKDKLRSCAYKYNIECEIPLINNYSFLIVLRKVRK